jgi:hypothetical protein
MIPETNTKANLRQRTMHEPKELVLISLYLSITLGAGIMVKTAVLYIGAHQIRPLGHRHLKAVVLPKFMLLGEAAKIGERSARPLIWPTLQKAFALLLLLIIMTIIEEAVVGLFHGKSIGASLSELFGKRLEEPFAGYVIMLLLLRPSCAFRVLDEALGERRLAWMFFVEQEPMERSDRGSLIMAARRYVIGAFRPLPRVPAKVG